MRVTSFFTIATLCAAFFLGTPAGANSQFLSCAGALLRAQLVVSRLDPGETAFVFAGHPYVVGGALGEGGMGVVHRVQQLDSAGRGTSHFLAGKRCTYPIGDLTELEGATREAKIAADAYHAPGGDRYFVPTFGVVKTRRGPIVLMKLMEGFESLQDIRFYDYTETEAAQLMLKVARAVKILHDQGIAHQDIKPSNIFVNRQTGEIRLIDFGLAIAPGYTPEILVGDGAGTPAYMPPEILEGEESGKVKDLYGIGAVLHTLMASTRNPPNNGRHPPHEGYTSVMRPELSPKMRELLSRATNASRSRRYQTADELIAALESIANPPSFWRRIRGR